MKCPYRTVKIITIDLSGNRAESISEVDCSGWACPYYGEEITLLNYNPFGGDGGCAGSEWANRRVLQKCNRKQNEDKQI